MYYRNNSLLQCETKIATDDILIFYFYLSKKIRLDFFHVNPLEEDSLETSSLIFSEKKNEKIFMNNICCSCDWRF